MDAKTLKNLIHQHGAEKAIALLAPYLTKERKARIETLLPNRMGSVHVAIESPADPHNAATIVRTCEALGAMSVHVIKAEDKALHAKGTTQGAFHWVNTHHHASLENFLSCVRVDKLTLAGACMAGDTNLSDVPVDKPLCLFLGNEKRGLSTEAKKSCDLLYRIPMFGMSESLNLSVSAGISLYDILSRKRKITGKSGDLSEKEKATLRLKYYVHSLEDRLVKSLLK